MTEVKKKTIKQAIPWIADYLREHGPVGLPTGDHDAVKAVMEVAEQNGITDTTFNRAYGDGEQFVHAYAYGAGGHYLALSEQIGASVELPDETIWGSWDLGQLIGLWKKADGINWLKGDIAAKVHTTYGNDDLGQFANRVGESFSAVKEYRRVALRYPRAIRMENVSWSVHVILSKQDDREDLIRKAAEENWTAANARDFVRSRKGGPDPNAISKMQQLKNEIERLQSELSTGNIDHQAKAYDEGYEQAQLELAQSKAIESAPKAIDPPAEQPSLFGDSEPVMVECPTCHGTGKVVSEVL